MGPLGKVSGSMVNRVYRGLVKGSMVRNSCVLFLGVCCGPAFSWLLC